eukprot:TRINITY_DN841_c0_g1_i4.p1 TRINITY_DN841_c0_g1~~TRINITY_DN841_c0_g1_i4.p1  ORF type:complete len:453 (+),score=130.15 TRINITY_DN841_c0_g1_i4:93-1451(+)
MCIRDRFKNAISGREHVKKSRKEKASQYQGGAQIKIMYYHLLKEYSRPDYKITQEYDDDFLNNAIILHEGDSMPGFPSADVFVSLIQPQVELLKNPALDLLQDVYNYLEDLASSIQSECFIRFPSFGEEIMEKIIDILQEEREKTRYLVESIIESEQTYMFTNDPEYLNTRTDIVTEAKEEKKEDGMPPAAAGAAPGAPAVQERPNAEAMALKKEKKAKKSAMIFLNELKARLDCYFRIVVRNIRDTVPRLIGHFLVRSLQNKMQIELFKRLNQMFETVNRSMGEPIAVIQERKALTTQLDTLRKAERVLTRDPEITTMISTSDDELLVELRQEKIQEASGKAPGQKAIVEKCMQSVLPEARQSSAPKPAPVPASAPASAPAPAPPKPAAPAANPPKPVAVPGAAQPRPSAPQAKPAAFPSAGAAVGAAPKPNPFGNPPAKGSNLFADKPKK